MTAELEAALNQLARMQHPAVADQLRACRYFHEAEVIEKIVSAWCTMNGLPVPTNSRPRCAPK